MTKDEAIKKLEETVGAYLLSGQADDTTCGEWREILETLEQGLKWIPVSERLPKLGQEVLCYCQAKIYDVLKYTKDGWFKDAKHCYMDGFVIAWMPLPEPYKESD